jgi:hypothetical protein
MKSFKDIRVAEARASISVGSADKKPENYRDPDGKIKVRMVPVKKTVVQYEAVDYEKLTQLARYGLVDKSNVNKLIASFKKMEDGKVLAPQQRELMLNVLTDLTGIVTGDTQMFQKAKKAVKEGTLEEAMGHIGAIQDMIAKEREEKKKRDGAKAIKKERVEEATMTAAQKAKFDALYKQHLNGKQHKILKQTIQNPIKADSAYHSMIKTLAMKEDTQIDEISMGKMAAYADKAVKSRNDAKARTYSADTHRVAKAGETIRKRKAGADNYNKKMWGYANVAPTKESVDEAKVGPSHDEIMKAIGNTQSSAQGMAILQKKFKLTAAQARKHMDMFLKDDVQIDEMGAFMSSPLPTPMSMRKDPSMTRPLMLTKQMGRAAELIKKAGNTPKLPTNEGAIAGHLRKVRALKDAGNSKADAHAQSKKMGTPAAYVDMVYNQKKDKIVDSKKFDVYKKHMKTHNLDEPTVRMAHDNPDHGESKRMMKNPKYSKGLELYKASMKEATYSDTGWQKPEVKKDQSGNAIKDKNVAKTLAKSGLRRTKDLEAAQKAKYLTFSKVKK